MTSDNSVEYYQDMLRQAEARLQQCKAEHHKLALDMQLLNHEIAELKRELKKNGH